MRIARAVDHELGVHAVELAQRAPSDPAGDAVGPLRKADPDPRSAPGAAPAYEREVDLGKAVLGEQPQPARAGRAAADGFEYATARVTAWAQRVVVVSSESRTRAGGCGSGGGAGAGGAGTGGDAGACACADAPAATAIVAASAPVVRSGAINPRTAAFPAVTG